MIKSAYESIASTYVDYYNQYGQDKTYDFLFSNKFTLSVLNTLYENFMKDGIEPMDKLPQETKQKYYDIGCKYFEEIGDRIKASKAVYVLELITSN